MKRVLVSGDCVCDHNVYMGKRPTADSSEEHGVIDLKVGGGALLLKRLIAETFPKPEKEESTADEENNGGNNTAKDDPDVGFGGTTEPESLPARYHAFCLWKPQKDVETGKEVWRAVDPPLGYGHPGEETKKKDEVGSEKEQDSKSAETREVPEILVLDDAGLGMRNLECKTSWFLPENCPEEQKPKWIVLKLSGSIGQGALWERLSKEWSDRLILVVSANQLRREYARIGKGLSWEATVEDLVMDLKQNAVIKPLLQSKHLVITFGLDGVFWLENPSEAGGVKDKPDEGAKDNSESDSERADEKGPKCRLIFDAEHAEGEWESTQGEGSVFGYQTCMIASVVHQLRIAIDNKTDIPDLRTALMQGLAAARRLRQIGHGLLYTEESEKRKIDDKPGFPFTEIAEEITREVSKEKPQFAEALVPKSIANRGKWMFLDQQQAVAEIEGKTIYSQAAMGVATLGVSALSQFPAAIFGDLQTVDRKEIEGLRTIRNLIDNYEHGGPQGQPLNIGVFGPPGAGKSFGVKQIAKAVLGKDVQILTFNMSQFDDPGDIITALHQVRDAVLSQRTPVVFWDEFDSKNYQWLQYLLAPMQDGAFQEGQITHPIGKSIFILAGATGRSYESFGPVDPSELSAEDLEAFSDPQKQELINKWNQFVLLKGPDFKSRLVGYLNVLGPNIRQQCELVDGQYKWVNDPEDLYYPIRRALFIRGQFRLKDGKLLNMDQGVLRAMLEIPHYESGSRSLEFLCKHLKRDAVGRTPTRSNLPGKPLLNMHVDADQFWDICERDLPILEYAETLAESLHNDWLVKYAKDGNEAKEQWNELKDEYRDSNIQQALRIGENLRLVNMRAEKGDYTTDKARKDIEEGLEKNLQFLSEAEHNGWMAERIGKGWRYARIPDKDEKNRLHPSLVPYAHLTEKEKKKDQTSIYGNDGYIQKLERVGMRIVVDTRRKAYRNLLK